MTRLLGSTTKGALKANWSVAKPRKSEGKKVRGWKKCARLARPVPIAKMYHRPKGFLKQGTKDDGACPRATWFDRSRL